MIPWKNLHAEGATTRHKRRMLGVSWIVFAIFVAIFWVNKIDQKA